mgnify:CR=1 FL=1
MSKIKLDLKERSPALAEALKFFRDKLKRTTKSGIAIADDFQNFENVCSCDLYLEMTTTYRTPSDEAKSIMIGYIPKLEDIIDRFPNIRKSLRDYLPRLQEFAKRDNNLQELYQAYEKAFGGQAQ